MNTPTDIQNLAPLVMLNTDLFESQHSEYKTIRQKKRNSVNPLLTLITNHERLSVYRQSHYHKSHVVYLVKQSKTISCVPTLYFKLII